jgi:hypothetical protein
MTKRVNSSCPVVAGRKIKQDAPRNNRRMNRIGFSCIGSDSTDSIQGVEEDRARPFELMRNHLIFCGDYAVRRIEVCRVGKSMRITIST